MKTLLATFAMLSAFSFAANVLEKPSDARRAENAVSDAEHKGSSEAAAPSSAPLDPIPRAVPFNNAPNVRVDLLVVSGSEKIILPLLPDLRNPEKVQAAQAKLLELASGGKVKIRDWIETTLQAGTRAVAESITEFKYPVEFNFPGKKDRTTGENTDAKANFVNCLQPVGVTFETRNLGTTLDAEPVVGPDNATIQIIHDSQTVFLAEALQYYSGDNEKGEATKIPEQQFGTIRSHSTLQLKSGERRLIAANKSQHTGDEWVLMILGAELLPAKTR